MKYAGLGRKNVACSLSYDSGLKNERHKYKTGTVWREDPVRKRTVKGG